MLLDFAPVVQSSRVFVSIGTSIMDASKIFISGGMSEPSLGGIALHVGLHA